MSNDRNASLADGTNPDSSANKAEFADHILTTPFEQKTASEAITADDLPEIRKVGRYLLYAPCALGFGILVGVTLLAIGLARDMALPLGNLCAFFAFLALRDIEKDAFVRARKGMRA